MTKPFGSAQGSHNIASSGSAEILCQNLPKIATSAKRLGHRKVRRSIIPFFGAIDHTVLWREIGYVAIDAPSKGSAHRSGYGTIENFLKQYALDSLEMVAERKRERALISEKKP